MPDHARAYRDLLEDLAATTRERQRNRAVDTLVRVVSLEQLDDALARFPELRSEAVRAQLERDLTKHEVLEHRRFTAAVLDLLGDLAAGTASEPAFARFAEAQLEIHRSSALMGEFSRLVRELDALAEDDPDGVIELGEPVIEHARTLHEVGVEAAASLRAGIAHLQSARGDIPEHQERGIALLQRADELFGLHPDIGDIDDRGQTLANLASAYGARIRFDPVANQHRAIELGERLLSDLTIADGDIWAKAHTNLAASILELSRDTDDRDDHGRLRRADEIFAHLGAALRQRSFDRRPLDWAYTQMTAGIAHTENEDNEAAVAHFEAAERGYAAAGHEALRGLARSATASARISRAQHEALEPAQRAAQLAEAERDAAIAAEQLAQHGDAPRAGEAWWQLARATGSRADGLATARAALERCLGLWTPSNAPSQCLRAAETLALLAERDHDSALALQAWRTAADAADAVIAQRASRADRLAALVTTGDVFRRAALGLARADRLDAALEVVELGRARELATWLDREVALDDLRLLAPELAAEYERLRHTISAGDAAGPQPGDLGFSDAVEALAGCVRRIRALPGHAAFLGRATLAELTAEARLGQTIAFPLLGNDDSRWVLLTTGDAPRVSSVMLPRLARNDVLRLLAGDPPDHIGYLDAVAASEDLDTAIGRASATLGETLLRPLADELAQRGATEVCIVPLGLLALLPLHALTWTDGARTECLLDRIPVTYIPSVYSRLVCERRAGDRAAPRAAVCVGDPSDNLDYGVAEAQLVAELLGAEQTTTLLGGAATPAALAAAVRGASHVHLACHGWAALTADALDAALDLAGGTTLTAREVVDLDLTSARLVVASACQTGLIGSLGAADEALAIGSVLIGAGAAGVVASLWAVDDWATALLMARHYTELAVGAGPAAALRTASLWLRDATADELHEVVARHPALAPLATVPPGRPFAAPSHWAGFVFSGA